jgi:hypothetical protein
MEAEVNAEELAAGPESRRAVPRFGVDADAHLRLVIHGSTLPCRVLDLSLSGCRVRTEERFLAGMLVRVEVNFKVKGLPFRFGGVTQWTDGQHQVGVRFVDVPQRRKDELVEALAEVEAEIAAKAAREAAEELAAQQEAAASAVEANAVTPTLQAGQEVA